LNRSRLDPTQGVQNRLHQDASLDAIAPQVLRVVDPRAEYDGRLLGWRLILAVDRWRRRRTVRRIELDAKDDQSPHRAVPGSSRREAGAEHHGSCWPAERAVGSRHDAYRPGVRVTLAVDHHAHADRATDTSSL